MARTESQRRARLSGIDPRLLDARRNARTYITSTTVIAGPWVHTRDPLTEGYRDAADECPHGTLPGDRNITCRCWTMEAAA
jgi:hypothetical protein